jgi:hypothetical protein
MHSRPRCLPSYTKHWTGGTMSAARELARTLGGRKAGAGYVARCPAHSDHNPHRADHEQHPGQY